jgi:prolyl oligopeptidase PreP (S9A serine peptidase family)
MKTGHHSSEGYGAVPTGDGPAHMQARGRLGWLKEGPTFVLSALQVMRQGSEFLLFS